MGYSRSASDDVVDFLVTTFNSHLSEPKPLLDTTPISEVGIDSFDFVEILFKIEDKYGIDLDYNANVKFEELTTIRELADQILQSANRKVAA